MAASGRDKRCCVPNCGKTRLEKIKLHVFPDPNKEPDRFRTWLYAIGGDILALDNEFIHKYCRICHSHFEPRYYTWSGRVTANAVPTLYLPGFSINTRQPMMDVTNMNLSSSVEKSSTIELVTPSTSDAPLSTTGARKLTAAEKHPSNVFDTPEAQKKGKKRKAAKTPYLYCKEAIALNRQVRSLKIAKMRYATRLKKALNLSENTAFQKALRNFTAAALVFTLLQFREVNKNKMGRRFTKKEKIMALSLYKQGPKAYRWLRRIFVLPAPITLSRMITRATLKPGINENLFQQLKKRARSMKASEKVCVLLFDEIALKPHFDYNPRMDSITGFVNNGVTKTTKIADHALVFMIRGVQKNFKQPICYTFCSGSTSKDELAVLIKTIIKKLKATGFNVIATICDQGATNVSAINYLVNETKSKYIRTNNVFDKYIFEVEGYEIIPLFDPPHLLKGLRNNLLNKDLKYIENKKEKTAKWEHIVLLYHKSPSYKGIKLAPKLTEYHVNPQKLSKMKVKFAAQVFSQTVGSTIGFYADSGILPDECRDTADLILIIDDLFDSVNGSHENMKERSGKPLLGPLTPRSLHQQVWTDVKPVLQSMHYITKNGKSAKVPTIINWIRTIENFEYLKRKLFNDHNLKSIWLRHFNQDPLENFFGCIRSHGCRNTMPTCTGFESAFASLLINNLSSNHSPGSNCEQDSAIGFKSLNKLFFNNKTASEPSHVNVNFDHLNENIIVGLENKSDPRIKAQLEYVSGYVLRRTKIKVFKNCKKCQDDMFDKDNKSEYIKLREHNPNKKYLMYPSKNLIKCFSDIQDVVIFIINDSSAIVEIKNYIKTVLCIIIDFSFLNCNIHKKENINFIQDLSCRFFLYNWCRDVNRLLSGKRLDFNSNDPVQKMAHTYYVKRKK